MGKKPSVTIKITPDVPRTRDASSTFITDEPMAPAAWSPAPATTGTIGKSSFSEVDIEIIPVISLLSKTFGNCSIDISVAATALSLHDRLFISNHMVPEASETSVE